MFQGAALVALCFISFESLAVDYSHTYERKAHRFCQLHSGQVCENPYQVYLTSWAYDVPGTNNRYLYDVGYPPFPPEVTTPEAYDEDGCFSYAGTPYCPGDEHWYDSEGYNSEGCVEGLCPGDPGWRDANGYDVDGFDENGLDRGGLTEAEGGGYWGNAGTGGTPHSYIDPPYPVDPGAGNNRDGNNVLRCTFAYPISIDKLSVPGPVLDGLSACANECQYFVHSTIFDFDANAELVMMTPTGAPCSGDIELGTIGTKTYESPPPEDPQEPYDNLNFCYNAGGYLYCDSFTDSDPPECYTYSNGWTGQSIDCRQLNQGDDPPLCGVFNGVFHCLDQSSNCESFNGTINCVDENGNIIDHDSPDHVINGGNGDGDPTNDVFADSTDVQNNGQSTQDRIIQTLDARELARQIDNQLSDNFDGIRGDLSDINDSLSGLAEGDSGDGETSLSNLTDAIGGIGTDSEFTFDGSVADGLRSSIEGILPSGGSCANFDFPLLPDRGMTISIDTCQLALFRTVIEWFLYAITMMALFTIVTRSKQED
jgi:hypothetical protein